MVLAFALALALDFAFDFVFAWLFTAGATTAARYILVFAMGVRNRHTFP